MLTNEWLNDTVLSFGHAFEFSFEPNKSSHIDLEGRHFDLAGVIIPAAETTFLRTSSADRSSFRGPWDYDIGTGLFTERPVGSPEFAIPRWKLNLPDPDKLRVPINLLSVDVTPAKPT